MKEVIVLNVYSHQIIDFVKLVMLGFVPAQQINQPPTNETEKQSVHLCQSIPKPQRCRNHAINPQTKRS